MPTISKALRVARALGIACLVPSTIVLSGCGSTGANVALVGGGVVAATAVGARSPGHEIEQTYYLGTFDPQGQLAPTVYRVRVHGQASAISGVKFASGWVPADVIDALGSSVSFDKDSGRVTIERADEESKTFKTGRRLMLFGPEGFREAPANHRLVIVMGSSPQSFFSAIDESLGAVAQVTQEQGTPGLERMLFEALTSARAERVGLDDLRREIDADLPRDAK